MDNEFIMERKNEFYPFEEFGIYAALCEECDKEMLKYFSNKEMI